MDFETFIQSIFSFVKNCDNAYFLLYALATCVITQVIKKLVVNKVNSDVLHKFDFAVILPFVIGGIFALVDIIFLQKAENFTMQIVIDWAVESATIGALASVMFKLVSSLSGKSLKSLLKDDVFGVFYHQLLYFGTVRQKLVNKQITLGEFISQVRVITQNAKIIYQKKITSEEKRTKLFELLQGIVDEQSIGSCLAVIDKALLQFFDDTVKK